MVAFDDRVDVLAAPGGAADARAALEGLSPSFGATRYGPVFQQALDLAAGARGRLVVVTDLQRAGWEGESSTSLPAGWGLDIVDVLKSDVRANLAVTAATVAADRVVATIRNGGATGHAGRVRALLDGQEVAAADYTAPPGATIDVPIAWRVPDAGTLSVAVDDAEGLPADNARFVALGSRAGPRALVIAAEEPAVDKASGGRRLSTCRARLARHPVKPSRSSPARGFRPCRPTRCRTIRAWRCSRPAVSSGLRASAS